MVIIVCFTLIGLPLAGFLTFSVLEGIEGLWIGYFLGALVQMMILAWMTLRADWKDIAEEANGRMCNNYLEAESVEPDKFNNNDPSYYSLFDRSIN